MARALSSAETTVAETTSTERIVAILFIVSGFAGDDSKQR